MIISPSPVRTTDSTRADQNRSHAALDTATSVDVERTFSRGRLLLPHVRNRLSAQTTRALLCLGAWSVHGFIKKADLIDVAKLPDVKAPVSDVEMEDGWDVITLIRSDLHASE